jgi:2-polyprenyl-6-methoxyphenol hydroxylase-like FAD-dependent oxidoreductase
LASTLPFLSSVLPTQPQPPSITGIIPGRGAFPLRLSHASSYVLPRLALIGDAAHTVHPLAGQGVNLGFADVISLSRSLLFAIETGRDLGDSAVLEEYENQRRNNNTLVLSTVDTLKSLFSSKWMPVVAARSFGLLATNAIPQIKDQLIRMANGEMNAESLDKLNFYVNGDSKQK